MPETLEPQLDELRRRARRRLVGAVVLALAAAVLVPMLLESDPKPLGEDVSVKIPPVDNSKFVSKLGEKAKEDKAKDAPPAKPAAPAPEPPKDAVKESPKDPPKESSKEVPKETPAPAVASPVTKSPAESTAAPMKPATAETGGVAQQASAPIKTEAPPAVVKPAASEPAKSGNDTSKSTTSAAAKSAGYSVQLAAFSDDKGANALAGKLKKAGHPAYTEPYTTSRGTLWRVRVGPYATRDAAEAARGKLKAEGQNGIIAQAN